MCHQASVRTGDWLASELGVEAEQHGGYTYHPLEIGCMYDVRRCLTRTSDPIGTAHEQEG